MDQLPLTPRENQVIQLFCLGHSDQQVGRTLGISVYTVDGYRTNIYRKLRVSCRAAAVTVYLAHLSRTALKTLAAQAMTYSAEVAACEW